MNLSGAGNVTVASCPACGDQFIVQDNRKVEKTTRYTNDADIIRAKSEARENRAPWIVLLVLLLLLASLIGWYAITEFKNNRKIEAAEEAGMISAGYSADLEKEKYTVVEAHLKAAGFTNVELYELDNKGIAFWRKGKVKTISIGGETSFGSDDYFDPDSKVVISYYGE